MSKIKFDFGKFKSDRIAISTNDYTEMKWLFEKFAPKGIFDDVPHGCVEITLNDCGEFCWMDDHEFYKIEGYKVYNFSEIDFSSVNNNKTQTTKKENKQMEPKQLTQKGIAQQAKRERGKRIKEIRELLGIKKIIKSGNAVVYIYHDDTKLVEKCCKDDKFDWEVSLALQFIHRQCGSKSLFKAAVDKIVDQNVQVFNKKGGK